MSDQTHQTINVLTLDTTHRGGPGPRLRIEGIDINVLSENVNIFLSQLGAVLDNAPEKTGTFHLTEFTVTAEISGKGTLALLGSGGELSGSGGITFKFQRD